MKLRQKLSLNQRGWTLVELMIATAIMAIITPSLTLLFMKVQQGMAADEMHTQLQRLNENTFLRFHDRLLASRRFFQNDSSGVSFFNRVQFSGGAPPRLANSKLPILQPSGGSFSPVTAVKASFGNSMFFAAFDGPATINNTVYTAPLTVQGANVTYGNGAGPATIILDVYRFYYLYLSPSVAPQSLEMISFKLPIYRLIEWRSVQFADFFQINGLNDSTLKTRVVEWLAATGPANFTGGPITLSWDHTQTDPSLAFYTMDTSGNLNYNANVNIGEAGWINVTKVSTGILSSGFRYGISGNISNSKDLPAANNVPLFATANSPFPGGLEVGLGGASGSGKQVMFRSLLVAKGGSARMVFSDYNSIINIRDVW